MLCGGGEFIGSKTGCASRKFSCCNFVKEVRKALCKAWNTRRSAERKALELIAKIFANEADWICLIG